MQSKLSAPVLVLNINYEPLNVCTTRRALGLMFTDKASLVMNGRGIIRTVSTTYPAPSIIKIERMIKRPRPVVKLTKAEVFRRDNFTCQYCGTRTNNLTIDHIIPRHLGGTHTWENLVAACPNCNHKKGGRTVKQANLELIIKPKSPKASAVYLFSRYLNLNEEWLPFIEGW
jgi:5-methylcytosine-specific restriction endonuclease McrA